MEVAHDRKHPQRCQGIVPEKTLMGGSLAFLDGRHPEAIDYGSARLGNRMASAGRAPMDIQAASAVIAAA
jgi:hypothetical protein